MMKRNSAFETRISYIDNIQEFIDDLNNESVSMKTIENKYTNVFDVLRNCALNYKASVKDRFIDLTAFSDLNEVGLNKAVSNRYLCAVSHTIDSINQKCNLKENQRKELVNNCYANAKELLTEFDNLVKSIHETHGYLYDLDSYDIRDICESNNVDFNLLIALGEEFYARLNLCIKVMYENRIKNLTDILLQHKCTLKEIGVCVEHDTVIMSMPEIVSRCTDVYIDDFSDLLSVLISTSTGVVFDTTKNLTSYITCSQYLLKLVSNNDGNSANKILRMLCLADSVRNTNTGWIDANKNMKNNKVYTYDMGTLYGLWNCLLNQPIPTGQLNINTLTSFCNILKHIKNDKPVVMVLQRYSCSNLNIEDLLKSIYDETGVLIILSENKLEDIFDQEQLILDKDTLYEVLENVDNLTLDFAVIELELTENNESDFRLRVNKNVSVAMITLLICSHEFLAKSSLEYLETATEMCQKAVDESDVMHSKYYLQLAVLELNNRLMTRLMTLNTLSLPSDFGKTVMLMYRKSLARMKDMFVTEIENRGLFLPNRNLCTSRVNDDMLFVLNSYPDLKWCDISLVNRELLLTDLRTYDLYKLGRFDNCEAFEIEVTNALPEHVVDKLLGNLDVR